MLGVQVVLGPTAALKAIAKGVVGDKLLGDGIDWLSNQASSRVTAWATGADLQQVQYLLGADEKVLAGIKPEDRDALAAAHAGYGKIDVGSKTALATLLGVLLGVRRPADGAPEGRQYRVGPYNEIKGTVPGEDAHHVGQKAVMGTLIPGYDPQTAPAILVPKVGHTIRGPNGIVSRSTEGLNTPRDVVARDVRELRRVYPDIPNAKLRELIELNKKAYPEAFEMRGI